MTTNTENIHTALAAAQAKMTPPEKNAENLAFKRDGKAMKYADLTSVVESVRKPLTESGICWGWRSVEFMGGLAMECYLVHGASGTELSCAVPMHLDRQNMHGLKSAYTYAKRIGLESLTGQAPADDDDGNAASETPAKHAPKPTQPTQEALDMAKDAMQAADTVDQLRAIYADMPPPIKAALKGYATELSGRLKATPDLDDEIPEFGKTPDGSNGGAQ